MIVLDTNVVSEAMKPRGDSSVREWLDQQIAETLYLSATSLSELLAGIEILPAGKRREALSAGLIEIIERLFVDRILPFDREAATICAKLIGRARAAGRAISFADGQIAAIATMRQFAVATRDTSPFEAVGVKIIDPWIA